MERRAGREREREGMRMIDDRMERSGGDVKDIRQ